MKTQDKREEIISIGTELIVINGYNATGIEAVLKKAGVPKGSFYHYFGSKEEFGLAVIDSFANHYEVKLCAFFNDEEVPPLRRIRNYLENGLENLTENQCTKGSLIGNLSQELADQNERFRTRLKMIFREWKQRVATCLEEAQQKGDWISNVDPDIIADFILSGWEGAILQAKVMRSPDSLQNFINTLFTTVLRVE
jgi:TetR/AcrR family transcriptional regulator, transcriptional repressor for nem operon